MDHRKAPKCDGQEQKNSIVLLFMLWKYLLYVVAITAW